MSKEQTIDMPFSKLGLCSQLVASIPQEFANPTKIQSLAIPTLLDNRDVLAIAQTGSGKTLAYGLPLIDKALQHIGEIQSVILVPTRELAIQVNTAISSIAERNSIRSICLCGGVDKANQIELILTNPELIVATPGRLLDLINQGQIKLDKVNSVVLDEADRLLDMGFWPDINTILTSLPINHATFMFSATFPPELTLKANHVLNAPKKIQVQDTSQPTENIDETLYLVNKGSKTKALVQQISLHQWPQVLVFIGARDNADSLCKKLIKAGISAAALHGNKQQLEREEILDAFKNHKTQVLIATDILARGIHVEQLPVVINFELPSSPETYVHRIGRTARAGKNGIAISLVCHGESEYLDGIRKTTQRDLKLVQLSQFPVTDQPSTGQNKRAPRDKKANRRTANKRSIKQFQNKKK